MAKKDWEVKELLPVYVRLPADLVEKAKIHVAKRKSKSLQELFTNAVRAYLIANKGGKK